jgi:HxlR-like helix-turn-helix
VQELHDLALVKTCDLDGIRDRAHISRTQICVTKAHRHDRHSAASTGPGLPEGHPDPRPHRREMEHARHHAAADPPPQVEYSLTEFGRSMSEPVRALGEWVQAHLAEFDAARRRFDERDGMVERVAGL